MASKISAFTSEWLGLLFYVFLLIFTIQAIILSYHWFTYGSNRRISLIALATYLTGGAIFFITLATALALRA